MKRNLAQLADTTFDLLIIGGGIHGACAAWDAALRGLSVALVEKDDFGAATSANSLKVIHGGLRYLQQADFRRMRQSIRERSTLMRIAPHFVRPLPVLVPTYGHFLKGKSAFRLAFRLTDWLSADLARSVPAGKELPRSRVLGRKECLGIFPHFQTPGLTGGALWHDGQACNSERLTLSFLLSAAERGAELANYLEAESLIVSGSRVMGARVTDRMGGSDLEIRARVVLNAAGPWAGNVMALAQNGRGSGVQDADHALAINLIHRRSLSDTAVGIRSRRTRENDPVGGGGRFLFLAPWRDRTLIGTSYRIVKGAPDPGSVELADLEDLLSDCNESCPSLALSMEDITFYHWGLLPLTKGRKKAGASSLASEPRIIDHAREENLEGLISLIGVKYTTARLAAEQAIGQVFTRMGRTPPRCLTSERPLWGAEGAKELWDGQGEGKEAASGSGSTQTTQRLVECYGTRAAEMARRYRQFSGWDRPVAEGSEVLRCEIHHAVREEMALKLQDVVFRRTDLGTAGVPPEPHLEATARLMAEEVGWDEHRRSSEVREVLRSYGPLLPSGS